MSKVLVLPQRDENGKPYLSYSQISAWKKSKRDYIRQYFFGEEDTKPQLEPYSKFGKKLGKALETGDFSEFTEEEQMFLRTIPRYDEFERKIYLKMDGFYVTGYIDTNDIVYKKENSVPIKIVETIADYKTGEIHRRQEEYESDDYLQIPIYAAAIEQETGYLPKYAYVFLIQRDGNAFKGEELTLGREYITITKDVGREVIDKTLIEIQEIAEEISEYYQIFLKLNGII